MTSWPAPPAEYAGDYQAAAAKWDVPLTLLEAQGYQESGYNPNAVSSAGAEGIAQFMPDTAQGIGLTDPFDPAAAIDAQARLMHSLFKSTGDWGKALWAYNAGSGSLNHYGDPTYAKGQPYYYVKDIEAFAAHPPSGVAKFVEPGGSSLPAASTSSPGNGKPAKSSGDGGSDWIQGLDRAMNGDIGSLNPFSDTANAIKLIATRGGFAVIGLTLVGVGLLVMFGHEIFGGASKIAAIAEKVPVPV